MRANEFITETVNYLVRHKKTKQVIATFTDYDEAMEFLMRMPFDRRDQYVVMNKPVHENTIKLSGFGPSEKTKEWVAKVNDMFPESPLSRNNRIMTFGQGNDMSIVQFELTPKQGNKVELKWIQATPLRSGAGSKAVKILQDLAQQDGIALTLFPWDKGAVSQAKLIKFYKKQGFNPIGKSKNMIWEPK